MERTEGRLKWPLWGLTLVLALAGLGGVPLFDWDEINFAEAAREMLITGDYLRIHINYRPFWEKPPLFFWKQAAAMHVWGINEWSARLPNALLGIVVSTIFLFRGRQWFGSNGNILWLLWWGSFLPHLYFKSGIIDPWFNAYMFFAAWATLRSIERGRFWPYAVVGAVLWGMAVLTKGPVAWVLVGIPLLVMVWTMRHQWPFHKGHLILFLFIMGSTASSWFVIEYTSHGGWFIREFVRYQIRLLTTPDAGHAGPWWYHLVVLYLGCFPASLIVINGLLCRGMRNAFDELQVRMWWAMLFTVLLVFSVVETKIIHYSSLAYYPIILLAGRLWEREHLQSMGRWGWRILLWSVAGLWVVALVGVVIAANLIGYWQDTIQDTFVSTALRMPVRWQWYGVLVPLGVAAFWWWKRRNSFRRHLVMVSIGMGVLAQWTWYYVLPRVERYTQGPAIDFYRSMAEKPAYVSVLGFKSYAHLFYTRKLPPPTPDADDLVRLLTQPVDSTVWFVTRVDRWERVQHNYPVQNLRVMDQRGGYLFLQRVR